MKRSIFLFLTVIVISIAVRAQVTSTADSIRAKYQLKQMPDSLTQEKIFPILGAYRLSTNTSSIITINLDASNKGIIWIDGLPQGKFKAYLRQAPGTYKIVAQKTEGDVTIPEGTLIYDPSANNLNIALGKAYNDANPSEVFSMNTSDADSGVEGNEKAKAKKSKSKIEYYSATKITDKYSPGG